MYRRIVPCGWNSPDCSSFSSPETTAATAGVGEQHDAGVEADQRAETIAGWRDRSRRPSRWRQRCNRQVDEMMTGANCHDPGRRRFGTPRPRASRRRASRRGSGRRGPSLRAPTPARRRYAPKPLPPAGRGARRVQPSASRSRRRRARRSHAYRVPTTSRSLPRRSHRPGEW